jgi:FK506-binding nuclear protein
MAALDPTEPPEADEDGNIPNVPRSTLKLIRRRVSPDEDVDEDFLERFLANQDDDDDSEDDDDEPNGGPSDKAKSKKAKAEALKKLIAAANEEGSDEEMEDGDAKPNGAKPSKKGKEPATSSDDDDDESISSDDMEIEELVVCTLDTERVSQPCYLSFGGPPPNTASRTINRR